MNERKVALVTDGMSALGGAICRRLHHDGFQVAALYPPQQRDPQAWLAAQRDEGYSFLTVCADLGSRADCAVLVDKLMATYQRIDVLVEIATPPDGSGSRLCDVPAARWQTVRAALDGAFHIDQLVLPVMLARQWGRIVQVAAGPAWPLPGTGQGVDHAAANAALQGFARALALEVARQGVTVNTIVPGCLACDGADPGAVNAALSHIPVGRLGAVEEVAGLVAYLASDAAGFVTGACIAINGGQHML